MSSSESRQTDAARRILDAAGDLLYTRGINSVGVDLLARTAGVTKKTVYDRFGSKEAVIAAYLTERRDRWHGMLGEAIDRAAPGDRLLAPFEALTDWQAREPWRGCAFANALVELPEGHAESAREVAKREKAFMQRRFKELAREQSAVGDPDELGRQLFLLHEGATAAYALGSQEAVAKAAKRAAENLIAASTSTSAPSAA